MDLGNVERQQPLNNCIYYRHMIADVCFDISLAFLSRRILIKRPVNVCDTIYRPLCYWLFGCAGGFCDWNGF